MELKYPMEDQSWINFRLDAITRVVNKDYEPSRQMANVSLLRYSQGPSMARKMVRQDWGQWSLDAYFPMIYKWFYYEGPEWIGRSVKEKVYRRLMAGLKFMPD